jgi:hypothetical protein
MLQGLQCETFEYFMQESNSENGLIKDKTEKSSPASIAATGMGLSCLLVAVHRGFCTREYAVKRTLTTLKFFIQSEQSQAPDAAGYKGFYYHFLDMETGQRSLQSELSSIDTAFLMAGILSAVQFFDGSQDQEREVRDLGRALYDRVDWKWGCNGGTTLTHGWKPETGFLKPRWDSGYSEALLLYMLALGSTTFPIEPKGYQDWTATFEWIKAYEIEYLYAGPLFIHQLSHQWIDFKGIRDDFNRKMNLDYFENSRRATLIQQKYAIDNPMRFEHYGELCWGFTASDGPGEMIRHIRGRDIQFFDYTARGAPYAPDDGTISPWAVVASLPFAPEIVLPTVQHAQEKLNLRHAEKYGLESSVNLTFNSDLPNAKPWISPYRFGINQGPIILSIENYESRLLWDLMKGCEPLQRGLSAAGFAPA